MLSAGLAEAAWHEGTEMPLWRAPRSKMPNRGSVVVIRKVARIAVMEDVKVGKKVVGHLKRKMIN